MSQRERATELIFKLQAVKEPLDGLRQPLWAELKELLASVSVREQELRQEIKAVQDQVAPLDIIMADISRAGNYKSEAGAKLLLDELEEKANGFTN